MSLIGPTATEIKVFRMTQNISQGVLAERLGASKRTVEDWEGARRPAPPMLRLALAALAADLEPFSVTGSSGGRVCRPG